MLNFPFRAAVRPNQSLLRVKTPAKAIRTIILGSFAWFLYILPSLSLFFGRLQIITYQYISQLKKNKAVCKFFFSFTAFSFQVLHPQTLNLHLVPLTLLSPGLRGRLILGRKKKIKKCSGRSRGEFGSRPYQPPHDGRTE